MKVVRHDIASTEEGDAEQWAPGMLFPAVPLCCLPLQVEDVCRVVEHFPGLLTFICTFANTAALCFEVPPG